MGSPLHRARAGEQRLSERVADGAETKLVTRLRLSEKLDDPQRPPAFGIREVKPGDRGHGVWMVGTRAAILT
jgi:hypothetical protein